MFPLFITVFKLLINTLFYTKKDLLMQFAVLSKENEILKRRLKLLDKKITFCHSDRLFYTFFMKLSKKVKNFISLVQPRTVLNWYKKLIKNRWTFPHQNKPGRPSIPAYVKNLILQIKNENIFMRSGKIQGELKKLGIDISVSTIQRILRDFRKKGKIKSTLTWKTFIKSHMQSLFAMDFLTVDPLFNCKRYYVFFIIYLKTRKIIQFSVTDVPDYSFVRNQLLDFSYDNDFSPYLIHDGSGEFTSQNYKTLGIKNIRISPKSPNMNAYAERFIGSVRRELLDNFIIFSYNQLFLLLKKYVFYYNNIRPHQGIEQQTPLGYIPETKGKIVKVPVLGGLWNHYTRVAA